MFNSKITFKSESFDRTDKIGRLLNTAMALIFLVTIVYELIWK